jgi:dihydroorotase-like cyclic amidohydrolase
LNEEDVDRLGPYAKINPPIRHEHERARLWDLFASGVIETIGTDHGPQTLAAKEKGWANIFDAPAGAPGLETMLPLLLTKVTEGAFTLESLVKVASETPARLFRLFPKKGAIALGGDADLVVVDMERETILDMKKMFTKQREAARLFHGRRVRGVPVMTLVRGRVVMRNGELTGQPGYGEFLRPPVSRIAHHSMT